jgi:predicted nucleic acid-binding Zn ribbon protein
MLAELVMVSLILFPAFRKAVGAVLAVLGILFLFIPIIGWAIELPMIFVSVLFFFIGSNRPTVVVVQQPQPQPTQPVVQTQSEPSVMATPAQAKHNKQCSKYGMELPAYTAFCPKCGTNQEPYKLCPKCGLPVESEGAIYCPRCGETLLASLSGPASVPQYYPSSGSNTETSKTVDKTEKKPLVYCYFCGASMPEDARYCRICGKPQE